MIYLAISRQNIWLFGLIESVCVLESGDTELVRLYSCALLCTSHWQTSLVSSSSVLPQCYLSWGVKQQIISFTRNTPAPAFTCKNREDRQTSPGLVSSNITRPTCHFPPCWSSSSPGYQWQWCWAGEDVSSFPVNSCFETIRVEHLDDTVRNIAMLQLVWLAKCGYQRRTIHNNHLRNG